MFVFILAMLTSVSVENGCKLKLVCKTLILAKIYLILIYTICMMDWPQKSNDAYTAQFYFYTRAGIHKTL